MTSARIKRVEDNVKAMVEEEQRLEAVEARLLRLNARFHANATGTSGPLRFTSEQQQVDDIFDLLNLAAQLDTAQADHTFRVPHGAPPTATKRHGKEKREEAHDAPDVQQAMPTHRKRLEGAF